MTTLELPPRFRITIERTARPKHAPQDHIYLSKLEYTYDSQQWYLTNVIVLNIEKTLLWIGRLVDTITYTEDMTGHKITHDETLDLTDQLRLESIMSAKRKHYRTDPILGKKDVDFYSYKKSRF